MDIQDLWDKAVKKTEIVRPRVQPLATFEATRLPYICLSESSLGTGDTVVRKGEVVVEKPAIIAPFNTAHFEGFEFDKEMHVNEDTVSNFFLVRGVSFPSMKYNNKTSSMDIYEGSLSKAITLNKELLQQSENTHTGLVMAPNDCWQFSILIFVGSQILRSAEGDIKRLFEERGGSRYNPFLN